MDKWIVAIGASGKAGLQDLSTLLASVPSDLGAVVLIVLHRPWDKPSELREVLSKRSAIPIEIAGQGDRLKLGVAYIGEPDIHLTLLERSFALLTADRARDYGNRTVDLLFHSVADCTGKNTVGVILSGALDDGSRGLAAIHHTGGYTMVVTPSEPPNDGMPKNAILYDGPISFTGSATSIAIAIAQLVSQGSYSA